jgi:AcrR family transcriptional regulator
MSSTAKAEAMDEQRDGSGIPAHLEAAWGLRERPAKGPKRGLSLDRIVEAAIQVAESDGLSGVSMSRVAAKLGSSTMALYRYVTAKDELLMLMMDAALGSPPADRPAGKGWRAGLTTWALAERDRLYRNTWALHIPMSAPPMTPNQIAWLEWGLSCLRGTGLTADEKISMIILLSGYVWRETTIEVDMVEATRAAGSTVEGAAAGYGQILAKLADPGRFPEVHAAIAEGAFDDDGGDPDKEFTFGLARVLDGIEVYLRKRESGSAG